MNKRLRLIGDKVPDNSVCLDVGCDHAFLDIYLVKSNRGIRPIASDVAKGPLDIAKSNIEAEGLSDKIETRLGNGLETYTKDINTIVISGMGGRNIIGILKYDMKKLKTVDTLILSPNNYHSDVKEFLCRQGFYIFDEEMIKEKGIIYQVITFKKGRKFYTKKQFFFGPIFLIKKDELFREYYEKELKSREIILTFLTKAQRKRRKQILKEIVLIKEELGIVEK